jgi:hypothetical protein
MEKQVHILGATREFPKGKITEADEGGLRMAIFKKDEKLIIEFGTPVLWLGMDLNEARDFARLILLKCDEVDPSDND